MRIVLPRPDDWHVHLRQGAAMGAYAAAHGAAFGRVLAMPNTVPPLTSPGAIAAYRRKAEASGGGDSGAAAPAAVISEASGGGGGGLFRVYPAFRLMPGMTPAEIHALADSGVIAGKYYPDGATTNSRGGLTRWKQAEAALEVMQERDVVLCVHAEDPEAPVLERERAFLPVFGEIRRRFPRLRMILEHISCADSVRMVSGDEGPTAATVTVQHLACTLDDLLGGHFNPHLYCKPVVKLAEDRESIRRMVFNGHPRFFFGSDSAPHARELKESDSCPAGAYTAPMILPALATIFEEAGCLNRLEDFLCRFGRKFYRMAPNPGCIALVREAWKVPGESEGCVPLMAGRTFPWRIERRA